jgi:hypothetical protein
MQSDIDAQLTSFFEDARPPSANTHGVPQFEFQASAQQLLLLCGSP